MKKLVCVYFILVCQLCFSEEISQNSLNQSVSIVLAEALHDSGDVLSSYTILNQIIREKESKSNYDLEYKKSLYDAFNIAVTCDPLNVSKIYAKLLEHDEEHCPVTRFESGRLVMENLPQAMCGKDSSGWIKQIFGMFGMHVSDEDIEYGHNSISVKMPACMCCPKKDSG